MKVLKIISFLYLFLVEVLFIQKYIEEKDSKLRKSTLCIIILFLLPIIYILLK